MLEKCMVVTILNYFTMLSPRGKEEPYKNIVKIFLFYIIMVEKFKEVLVVNLLINKLPKTDHSIKF